MSGATAFQANAFQNNAFQITTGPVIINLVDTAVLQLPINCVMIGDQPETPKRALALDAVTGLMRGIFKE